MSNLSHTIVRCYKCLRTKAEFVQCTDPNSPQRIFILCKRCFRIWDKHSLSLAATDFNFGSPKPKTKRRKKGPNANKCVTITLTKGLSQVESIEVELRFRENRARIVWILLRKFKLPLDIVKMIFYRLQWWVSELQKRRFPRHENAKLKAPLPDQYM